MLSTLNDTLANEPERKCFRLVGGVLVERTVKDVVPALQMNRDGVCDVTVRLGVRLTLSVCSIQIQKVISNLAEQYKTKEADFENFKRDYNIRPASLG